MAGNQSMLRGGQGGGRGRMSHGPKPKNAGKIFMRLLKYIFKTYFPHCIIVAICILVTVLASVQGTLFMQTLVDDYILPLIGAKSPDFTNLLKSILRVGSFYALGVIASYSYNRIMVSVTQGTLKHLRDDMFAHMEKLPIKYFDTHSHGDIMSIYTNDTDTLRQMISQSMPQLLSSVITVVSVFFSMLFLNVPLTILTLLMVGVMIFTSKKLAGLSGKFFMKQQKDLGTLNGYIEEMMQGQKVVKIFCYSDESLDKFKNMNDELCNSAYSANKFANILMPINAQLGNISYVLCAIFGGILALKNIGGFTLGSLASFLTFNKSFSMPINQVSMQLNSIVMALAGAERIFTLLDEKEESDHGDITLVNAEFVSDKIVETNKSTGMWAWKYFDKDKNENTYKQLNGDVVFKDVNFGYDEKIVLHNINLYAKPGHKIAFVGSTGAGKTTITNLINRFYDIKDGTITYDGINISDIKKDDLRRSLGIVLQDTHLFTGTVMDNIRYGKLDATDEEVIAAAKLANAHGFIKRLPDGYNTQLKGDGSSLSQGQKQLIAIARVAVANPPVLILDEATSSIDTRTEKIVQEGMDRLMHGRTTFVIAHRLSTVKNSNCIMVLEQGKIIERGTHEELLKENGRYHQLYMGNNIKN